MNILIKNAQIVPSGGEQPFSGSIYIENGVITSTSAAPDGFSSHTVIDAKSMIAMPGLINAHTHSPMGVLRNYADDLSFSDWLFGKIIPAESKLNENDVYYGAMLGITEMIKSGTTCFADMYLHMDSIAKAVIDADIRANLSIGPITSAVRGGGLIVDSGKCRAFLNKFNGANNGKINVFTEIHSVYLFDEPSVTEAALLAKELNTGIHIHLSESKQELAIVREKYGMSPVEAAHKFGVFNVPVIAAHCVWLNENDIDILKNHEVYPVHNISSNLKLGVGIAPAARLLKEGLPVCLGTDGSASNNNLNMFEEMHIAALVQKGVNENPECMNASAVINMATQNAANGLGFNNLGKIEPGYVADIILINADKPHLCPLNNEKSAVVYSVQASDVDTVISGGEILMKHRAFTKIDEELIKSKVKDIAGRIL